jgi:hypothetical protein
VSETVAIEENPYFMDEDATDETVTDAEHQFICVNDERNRCRTR